MSRVRSCVALLLCALLAAGVLTLQASEPADAQYVPPPRTYELAGRYVTGGGSGTSEVVAAVGTTMYVTNGMKIDVVDFADPAAPVRTSQLDVTGLGAEPTSVAVAGQYVAVAVPATTKTDPGSVAVFRASTGAMLAVAPVGALPDMVTFAGSSRIVVANEGEANSYGQPDSVNPEGSVSIINIPLLLAGNPNAVRTATFTAFNVGGPRAAEADGLRFNGPGATRAQDIEPEYIAVVGSTAWVTLQENNAVARIDLATAQVVSLLPLGTVDHSQPGRGLDPSDRDNAIAIANWPVSGLRMPDAIAAFSTGGTQYLVTANEGDARDWTGFNDERRVGSGSFVLDPTAYPNAAALKQNGALGRLTASTTDGDTDGDGDIDRIHAFGSRSVTIWNTDGTVVWESGDLFEQLTAIEGAGFNSNHEATAFDDRSDNKGPEPESVTAAKIGGRDYVFVGLERVGGVVVLDVTTPSAPQLVQYLNNRNFATAANGPDLGPEIVTLVRGTGTRPNMLLVSNEVSGSVTIYRQTGRATNPDGAGRLTLLHNNDGESSLLPFTVGSVSAGGVGAFRTVLDRETFDARNRNHAVMNVYAGDAFLASAALECSDPAAATGPVYDAIAQAQMNYTAHALGNHEFDFGPGFLSRFIQAFAQGGVLTQPFLSANLDVRPEASLWNLADRDGLVSTGQRDRVIGRSAIHVDQTTNQRFGIVSAITPALATISSPGGVLVTSTDIPTTAAIVQAEVDRLTAMGVRKIVLVSHLQDVNNDRALIPLLRNVDIVVAGGGDEQLTSPAIPTARQLIPGDAASVNTYPIWANDADGVAVPLVTTSGNYKYVGRLDAAFDDAGRLVWIDAERSYPRRVVPVSTAAFSAGVRDGVVPNATLVSSVETPVASCLSTLNATVLADTAVAFNVARGGAGTLGVRTRETNGGNLVTDGYLAAYDRYAAGRGLPDRATTPVIAIQNGGGIRQNAGDVLPVGGVVPGSITRGNTLNVLAFNNSMVVTSPVTPEALKSILERSAASIDPATLYANNGAFLQVAGFSVTYRADGAAQVVSNPAAGQNAGTVTAEGSRVWAVTLADGTPIVADGAVVPGAPSVLIVTNNFTAAGGDNYPQLVPTTKTDLPVTYEQTLVQYLQSFPVVNGRPLVAAGNPAYDNPAGEGRITIVATAP